MATAVAVAVAVPVAVWLWLWLWLCMWLWLWQHGMTSCVCCVLLRLLQSRVVSKDKDRSDARRLTQQELNRLLVSMGEPIDEVQHLTRWEKVRRLIELHTRFQDGDTSATYKYARSRNFTSEQLRTHKWLTVRRPLVPAAVAMLCAAEVAVGCGCGFVASVEGGG